MHRDEHVRLLIPGTFDPDAMRQVVVIVARENRTHAGFAIDPFFQALCDSQGYILFPRPPCSERTGILAAVTGVDGHNHIAP